MQTLVDLTLPLTDAMPVFPGDEPPRLIKVKDIDSDGYNNFRLSTGMHAGTHIDGPMHLTQSKKHVADLPLENFIGIGCLLNAVGQTEIHWLDEYDSLVKPHCIVLIHTRMSRLFGRKEYYRDYPVISKELAQRFVERKVKMVCVDSPSPDRHPYEIHTILLGNNILIGENLTNMESLRDAKRFEVFAFPLNIKADSSPARIIARILE